MTQNQRAEAPGEPALEAPPSPMLYGRVGGCAPMAWIRTVPPEEATGYDRAMPFWQSYAGLRRYWETRAA